MIPAKFLPFLGGLVAVFTAAGCATPRLAERGIRSSYRRQGVEKPVLAVVDFENRADLSSPWNLGKGMADLLVTALLDTERVTVLERKDLKDVVEEIVLQGRELFRQEGRVRTGRLRSAQYLARGVVTDFGETSRSSGWFGIPWLKIFGRGSTARVAINVKVSDVESGEIVSSVKADKAVSAGGAKVEGRYKNIAFGGDAFFRTPLGRATEGALDRAVRQILRDLPVRTWRPMVAEVLGDVVVINGGRNVGVRKDQVFAVREAPREITDPATGNVIDSVPGKVVGRVKVRQVKTASADAVLLEGIAKRGMALEVVKKK